MSALRASGAVNTQVFLGEVLIRHVFINVHSFIHFVFSRTFHSSSRHADDVAGQWN